MHTAPITVAQDDARFPRGPGFYVYALCDPTNGQVRYIGKTTSYLSRRLAAHIRDGERGVRTHKAIWVASLLREGRRPRLVMLESVPCAEGVAERERWWIATMRVDGARLTNATDGGEGMHNPSEATRVKLRARVRTPDTPEVRARRVAGMKAAWADPERRAIRLEGIEARRIRPKRARIGAEGSAELVAFRAENARKMGLTQGPKNTGPKSAETRAKIAVGVRLAYVEGRLSRTRPPVSDETRAKLRAGQARRHGR